MTVQTNNNSISYVGNGSTAHFDYDYLILNASHLKVYFGDVLQTSGYVVSGVSSQTGGTVAFAVAPPNGTNITLIRDVPFLQLTDYQPYDAFPAESHERALDLLTMMTQQLKDELGRTMQHPVGGNKWDAKGNEIANVGTGGSGTSAANIDQVKHLIASEVGNDPSASASVRSREALRRSYAEAGYNLVDGSFEAGGTLVNANDVLLQERTGKAFSGPAGHVAAGTNPASGGFVDRSGHLLKAQLGAVSILEFDKDADLGYPHDAHPAWLKAKATGKQVIFPKPRNRYYMQGPMILEQNSIIGSGVGQAYGNTAVVVEFGGFTADYAVESNVKMNRFEGFYFTPRSWNSVSGFVGAGLKQAAMTVGIDSAFVGFKDGGHRISVPSSDTTTETWLSRYVRCSFEFNGKHGAHYKDAGNGTSFIDCNGRWNGSPAFMVQPTVQSVWDGINIESDKPTGSLSRPEGFYLSGGDWSYNSRYGFDVQSGYGGVMNPGYIELNLKNGGRVGGTAKGWKVRPRRIGQSIERNIESLFQTPLGGTIAKMPNEIDAGGIPLGTGGMYGDNATTIPSRELASDGAMHKILTYNWSGVWGSILRLMTKTGDMVYRAASADGRIMKLYLDKVQIEDQQLNDKTHKLVARVAREVAGLPAASAEYQNTMLFDVVDRKLYFCFYNSTAFEWKQVSLV